MAHEQRKLSFSRVTDNLHAIGRKNTSTSGVVSLHCVIIVRPPFVKKLICKFKI